jgi:hypothetical protein
LKNPVVFFNGDKFLDDPAFYGPRDAVTDPGVAQARIRELVALMAEHPGNPDNGVGSFEKKERERPAYEALRKELKRLRGVVAGQEVAA